MTGPDLYAGVPPYVAAALRGCRACGRPMVLAQHEGTGKWAPLVRDNDGQFVIRRGAGRALAYASAPGDETLPEERWASHYADCPAADRIRAGER